MIGAITKESVVGSDDPTPSAAEYFMRVCERKGDFSFVYANAPRDDPSWRPIAGALPPVLAWPSDGERQKGVRVERTLELQDMFLAERGAMEERAGAIVDGALRVLGLERELPANEVPAAIVATLRRADFQGCGAHVDLTSGYFFPVHDLPPDAEWNVAVSTDLNWRFGAPALLVSGASAARRVVDVGVFIGRQGDERVPIVLE
jgi:hypothetical protein